MHKLIFRTALAAAVTCSYAANADAGIAASSGVCGYLEEAPIFGVGMPTDARATPVMIPLEQGIVQRGDKSATLRSVPVPSLSVNEWTADYAMMRLSQLAGKPTWALTQDGQPGEVISVEIPATNLADAFDRVAAVKGKRWRYDGEKVYLLGGREWTMPLPANRDISLAVQDALHKNNFGGRIEGGVLRFEADDAGVARVTAMVNQVYSQKRLNPYDVKFFKVYPVKGEIDWGSLVERTSAVETISFDGKGATIVLDGSAGAVVDAFLAREGQVHNLGSTTMVSATASMGTSHAAGCGAGASGKRGLQLAGGAYDSGTVGMSYAILGTPDEQAGKLAVRPGSIVVIADAVPDEGGYMVAVVRPRVLELQGGVQTAPATPLGPPPGNIQPLPGMSARQVVATR